MMDKDDDSLATLQSRLKQLKATKASLQADFARLKEIPTATQLKEVSDHGRKVLSESLQALNQSVSEVEEKCILYRTAGWTVFEMDLDIGRRGREWRRQEGSMVNERSAVGLGVRLETYHKGRFYEPFYLIFTKQSQEISNGAKNLNPRADSQGDSTTTNNHLRLLRHTIPHFVPLNEIMHSYMKPAHNAEKKGTGAAGGLELLGNLMNRDGLLLFLSQLHMHLQSFVSRRQQAIALSRLQLPGLNYSTLRAFSNDSFGQLSIRWELPTPTSEDLKVFEGTKGILYPNNDGSEVGRIGSEYKEEGEYNTALEINIIYHDLSSDKVGRPITKEVSKRRQMVQSLGNFSEPPGLKCNFATILVESIRSKVPVARRGTSERFEKLQVQKVRRKDWELIFTRSLRQKSLPELEEALQVVTDLAWQEEMQNVIVGRRD